MTRRRLGLARTSRARAVFPRARVIGAHDRARARPAASDVTITHADGSTTTQPAYTLDEVLDILRSKDSKNLRDRWRRWREEHGQ